MEFPFSDAPNTATITCCHIVEEGEDILYASHDEDDGMWQFLCGRQHHECEARVVSLYSIYMRDKGIEKLAGMPCGCCAERQNKAEEWKVMRTV